MAGVRPRNGVLERIDLERPVGVTSDAKVDRLELTDRHVVPSQLRGKRIVQYKYRDLNFEHYFPIVVDGL